MLFFVTGRLRCLLKWFMLRTCRQHNLPRDWMFLQLRQQVSQIIFTVNENGQDFIYQLTVFKWAIILRHKAAFARAASRKKSKSEKNQI